MKRFYISDTHFDSSIILEYDKRPFRSLSEMNISLIDTWNSIVSDEDEVLIVGDFADCDGKRANELLSILNGKKFLVRGNHDTFVDDPNFDKRLLVWVKDYAIISGIILFHFPIAYWDKKRFGNIHIHGHIHSYYDTGFFEKKNQYNCAVTVNNYRPVTFEELVINSKITQEQMAVRNVNLIYKIRGLTDTYSPWILAMMANVSNVRMNRVLAMEEWPDDEMITSLAKSLSVDRAWFYE